MSQKVPSFTESRWRKLICSRSADRRTKTTESDLKGPISLSCTVGSERSPPDQIAIASYKSDKPFSCSTYELQQSDLTNHEDEHDASNNEGDSQRTDGNGFGRKYILEFSSGRPVITEVIGTVGLSVTFEQRP